MNVGTNLSYFVTAYRMLILETNLKTGDGTNANHQFSKPTRKVETSD